MNDFIYGYSRAQAIADGVLRDVSGLARDAGFRYPVALTRAVWCECVEVSDDDIAQDETGRLWDILNVLRDQARTAGEERVVFFDVLIAQGGSSPEPVRLKAHCGLGDNLEPVITVMRPDED